MREIRELVAQLTLEEKASLCSGKDFWHLKAIERLGIPSVMVSDGPHGLRKQDDKADHLGINDSIQAVCFPAACATACSFDPDLLYQMGSALGEECRAEGVSVLLGPAVNIKRSPLCGRNFEYFSEDPFLAGKLSAAQIQGVQQWNVGTSLKHFAANNQEYRRMSASSQVDERTLREIYLTAFEIAVKEAKPWTVMCSYNRLNGEYASESKKLLSDILREDWGFDGVVVSDWGAVNRRVEGLAAGLDLEMPASGGSNDSKLVAAVNEGTLSEAVLDKAVSRILTMVFRYADAPKKPCVFDREAHHALAVSYEKESAVLLQNNGVLPLSRRKKLAYIGAYAQKPRYQGGGSSHINASKVTNALDSARAEGLDVVYAEGFPFDKDEADEQRFAQAVAAARAAEVAVIFAGLPDSFESEGYDRQHMRLPDCQYQLIERIAAVQPNTVVVLHNGSPVELPFAEDVAAILELYLGGQGVGEATHALLFGDANPCGRLAETFPQKLSDNPSYLNFPGDG
ncbi:MAG: glycoside hydrolase family 3 protein, partial [Angelakisella sp.]